MKIVSSRSASLVAGSLLSLLGAAALSQAVAVSGGIPDYPVAGPMSEAPAAVAQYGRALSLVRQDPRLAGVFNSQCNAGAAKDDFLTAVRKRASDNPAPATKVMDNLYFFAAGYVSAWAVDTPDGIILIDTLNSEADARNIIIPGMRSLGLDPARIKHIVILHEHGDHYGGAKYLQDTYKARVHASEVAWAGMERIGAAQAAGGAPSNRQAPVPRRDDVVTDGSTITLGGETITLYLTPGHSPGTISALIPVTDHGVKHLAADWGGTSVSDEALPTYTRNLERFRDIAGKAGADFVVSSHQHVMTRPSNGFASPASGANPMIIGADGYRRYTDVHLACLNWYAARFAAGEKLRAARPLI